MDAVISRRPLEASAPLKSNRTLGVSSAMTKDPVRKAMQPDKNTNFIFHAFGELIDGWYAATKDSVEFEGADDALHSSSFRHSGHVWNRVPVQQTICS